MMSSSNIKACVLSFLEMDSPVIPDTAEEQVKVVYQDNVEEEENQNSNKYVFCLQ